MPEVSVIVPVYNVEDYVAKRSIGGLGIHLIRHYMDEVSYQRTNDQNVLTMKKNLKSTKNNKKNGSNNQKG